MMPCTNFECVIPGCGKHAVKRRFCNSHYKRWARHGDPLAGRTSNGAPLNFLESAIFAETDDCILWPFSGKNGYGSLEIDGATASAHRVICERINGPAPTPLHHAAHSCGNGALGCVNKRHLSWKTRAENEADKITHGTSNRGQRHGMAKLKEDEVIDIRARAQRGETPREIAEIYGVCRSTISGIIRGNGWPHLIAIESDKAVIEQVERIIAKEKAEA